MEKNLKAVNDHIKVMHARAVWAKPTGESNTGYPFLGSLHVAVQKI